MSYTSLGIGAIPPEYIGREQSYLKHRVLQAYLEAWSHKLGSVHVRGRDTRLWYVDAFAGPWDARSTTLADTSIAIGLGALAEAARTWKARGHSVEVKALFVEQDPQAFEKLCAFLSTGPAEVSATALPGPFGANVARIEKSLARDAAFIFVDPFGWKGAAMSYIKPLMASSAPRDVMINLMYDHLNRQKDREAEHVRVQMKEFFGLDDEDLPPGLAENELFELYRRQLKAKCELDFAAHLSIPDPTMQRTKFGLVVGGRHRKILEVFRSVEAKVVGREAGAVRDEVRRRTEEQRSGQISMGALTAPSLDRTYDEAHGRDGVAALNDLLAAAANEAKFGDVWPAILEARHLTLLELKQIARDAAKHGRLNIIERGGSGPRPRDGDDLVLGRRGG